MLCKKYSTVYYHFNVYAKKSRKRIAKLQLIFSIDNMSGIQIAEKIYCKRNISFSSFSCDVMKYTISTTLLCRTVSHHFIITKIFHIHFYIMCKKNYYF